MAGREVIYFPFEAQLSARPHFPTLLPPEPVAKSPPHKRRKSKARPRRSWLSCARRPGALSESRKGRTARTDIYAELHSWNGEG